MAQYKKEEIQELILQSAAELFASKGYKNTTIPDVAKRAGISVGNIYRYYKGKEQILEEVLPANFVEDFAMRTLEKLMTGRKESILEQTQDPKFKNTSIGFQKMLLANRYRICILYRYLEETPYESM